MDQNLEIFIGETSEGKKFIEIDGINFDELPQAPVRRESLARTTTSINMNGQIKRGYFPLLRNG